jgi:hypothetical protein
MMPYRPSETSSVFHDRDYSQGVSKGLLTESAQVSVWRPQDKPIKFSTLSVVSDVLIDSSSTQKLIIQIYMQ